MHGHRRLISGVFLFTVMAVLGTAGARARLDGDRDFPVIPHLPATPTQAVSTVPSNGNVNPYGVAFVPHDIARDGLLRAGDVLVSNFNASSNLQGTGTTVVEVSRDGHQSLFFQGEAGLGLTTAPRTSWTSGS